MARNTLPPEIEDGFSTNSTGPAAGGLNGPAEMACGVVDNPGAESVAEEEQKRDVGVT